MTQLTVVTPTWNRRLLLERVYGSLAAQDAARGRFVWLVIDDGSEDDTAHYVRGLAATADFPIKLIQQDHGGKHRAINRALDQVETDWLLVLDSDDWILPGGLAAALNEIDAAVGDPAVLAIVSPRVFAGRQPLRYPELHAPVTYATWREKYFRSDFSMLARTAALRPHPFPSFDGEEFVAESAVYARAFARGGIRLTNTRIMGAEYQLDGLSTKMRRNRAQSPRGAMFTYQSQVEAGLKRGTRARALANWHRFAWHARARPGSRVVENAPAGMRVWEGPLWLALGWLLYRHDLWRLDRARE